MRIALLISFLLSSLFCLGQNGGLKGMIIDTTQSFGYQPITLQLMQDSVEVAATLTNQDGSFTFPSVPAGMYQLRLSRIGERAETKDIIRIQSQELLQVSMQYPGPCLFNYPKQYQPRCPESHTDNIIKMVYGLPDKKTMRKAKKGKIHLAGCMVTGCDPAYYCQKHQTEF